jgi:hypothetical protein
MNRVERPPMVAVLGWLSIVSSAATILLTPVIFYGARIWRVSMANESLDELPPAFRPLMAWLVDSFEPLIIFQLAYAAVALWAGVEFLRLRPWSRTFHEVTGWVGLASGVAATAYGIWLFLYGDVLPPNPGGTGPSEQFFRWFGAGSIFLSSASGLVLPAIYVWLLRSRFVRPYFVE